MSLSCSLYYRVMKLHLSSRWVQYLCQGYNLTVRQKAGDTGHPVMLESGASSPLPLCSILLSLNSLEQSYGQNHDSVLIYAHGPCGQSSLGRYSFCTCDTTGMWAVLITADRVHHSVLQTCEQFLSQQTVSRVSWKTSNFSPAMLIVHGCTIAI